MVGTLNGEQEDAKTFSVSFCPSNKEIEKEEGKL